VSDWGVWYVPEIEPGHVRVEAIHVSNIMPDIEPHELAHLTIEGCHTPRVLGLSGGQILIINERYVASTRPVKIKLVSVPIGIDFKASGRAFNASWTPLGMANDRFLLYYVDHGHRAPVFYRPVPGDFA
jgi:hypothetical protein